MHTWGSKGSGEICYIKTWIFLFTKHVLRAWGHESNLDLYYLQYLSATFSQIQTNIFCFSKWISRSHMRVVMWHQYKPLKVYFWFITSKEVWLRNQLELGADVLFLIETVFFSQTIWGFNLSPVWITAQKILCGWNLVFLSHTSNWIYPCRSCWFCVEEKVHELSAKGEQKQ